MVTKTVHDGPFAGAGSHPLVRLSNMLQRKYDDNFPSFLSEVLPCFAV